MIGRPAFGQTESQKPEKVKILYAYWSASLAMVDVLETALEDVDIQVEAVPMENQFLWEKLANGEADITLEAILPNTHKDLWDQYGDRLIKIGKSYEENSYGLVVPAYVTVNSIEALKENKDRFNGSILGGRAGTPLDQLTKKVIKDYSLDYQHKHVKFQKKIQMLDRAISEKKWIAMTGYKPLFIWEKYDLKYLEDPKKIYGQGNESAYILARKGYAGENPGMKEFLKNVFFEDEILHELLLKRFNSGSNSKEATREWYQENKTMIQSWMPESWIKN
jgi:glycine betaine/proline transport system substrate-binding protein